MAEFKVVVGDSAGDTRQFDVEGQDANRFLGLDIGDEVDGSVVEADGMSLEITGGSDTAGRPMRADVPGTDLKELLLDGGVGYAPTREGERKRVTVRGRQVSEETVQINAQLVGGTFEGGVGAGEAADVEEETEEAEAVEEDEGEDEEAEAEADEGSEDEEVEADAEEEEAEAEEADEEQESEADADDQGADEDEE